MAGAASPLLLRLLRPGEPENDEEEEAAAAAVAATPGRRRLLPRCSPTPRPRSPQEEAEEAAAVGPEASAGPRRVRFADALGLPLLELRNFCPEAEPETGPAAPPVPCLEFCLPASEQEVLERLESGAALELESLGPCSAAVEEGEPPALRGLVRVRNLSYSKTVVVRASWDGWASYRDHPARYVPGSSDGVTDRFAFSLPCAGRRLEFVLRYQTPNEVFWANNQGRNYAVLLLPGTGEGILPPPACFAAPPLKSCLKPLRSRPDEPSGIENGNDISGWDDDLSKLLKPSPVKAEHMIQVPELMVTGISLEKKDFDGDQFVTFPEHNLPMYTEIRTCAADQGKLPIALEMEQGAGKVMCTVSEQDAFRNTKEQKEQPGVYKDMSVNREADVGLHTHAQFRERQVHNEHSYMGLSHVLPPAGEYDSEDLVVEEEMEQLYLSHLNRLRAEEELKSCSIGTGPEDEGVLLLRASLQSAYAGPARPRNSLLVEEISQHYTNGEGGLSDEAEPEENMRVPLSSDQLLCFPVEEEAKSGHDLPHPVEDMSLDKDWIPVSDGNSADTLDKVSLLLDKECNGDESERGAVPESPHKGAWRDLPKEEDTVDIALPKTDSSAALLVFPFNVTNEVEDVMSFPETRFESGDTQMVKPVIGIQEQAVDVSTGTTTWENSGSFASVHKTGTAEMSPTPLQGEAMLAFDSSPALAAALYLAFRFLCVLVFLPALLDSCTSLMAALLHLMSAWFL
uniref:Protein phosphatase 1 regulatory subunit 3F n=1 Tax=Geotrypetes seraphini TaxID=260995 RepID=A0A6P8PRN6_GEOSA|nr:protein phosphatase 1 regulatory subunit 3F [Geotrypetes seraphini]